MHVAYSICIAGSANTDIPVCIMKTSNNDIELFLSQKIAELCPMVEPLQCPASEVNYMCNTAHRSAASELKAAISLYYHCYRDISLV